MSGKRIAFIHFHTLRMLRGIETLVLSLSNELVKQGYDVSILTAKRKVDPLVVPDTRIKIHEFPVPRFYEHFFIAPQYALDLIRNQYDYVIVFFADFGEALAWHLAKPRIKHRTRLIVYLCYAYSAVPHRYASFTKAGFFTDAWQILTVAPYIANDAKPVVDRPINVVPNGTDPDRFMFQADQRLKIRQRYGYEDRQIVLLNVSALEPRKGVRRVINALPELLKAIPDIRYLILGQGADEVFLRQMVEDRGLGSIVTFAGTTTDLPAYYSAADIFVLLADFDANSIVSYEALSCRLPIVVSNTGSYSDVMQPEFARLIDPDQPADVIATLTELAQSPDTRAAMGKAGREYVEQHLSWKASATRLAAYLESASPSDDHG